MWPYAECPRGRMRRRSSLGHASRRPRNNYVCYHPEVRGQRTDHPHEDRSVQVPRSTETKASFKTTEFIAYLAVLAGILVLARSQRPVQTPMTHSAPARYGSTRRS